MSRPGPIESPCDRLRERGAGALSDEELVAVLLAEHRVAGDDLVGARSLLDRAGGLLGLAALSRQRLPGAERLGAAVELAARLAGAKATERPYLGFPEGIAAYLTLRHLTPWQEVAGALYLDCHNRLLVELELFRGCLHVSTAEPAPIFAAALVHGAAGLVLFHTHPSGDPMPSMQDISFTRRLVEAGKLLGVCVVDHLILGSGGAWVSLKKNAVW